MKQASEKTVLFLCTGNYYRSRFAEVLFNAVADKWRLAWRASSRGLALERGSKNVGPMAHAAVEILQGQGIGSEAYVRMPLALAVEDLQGAHRVIALQEAEHRPLIRERFPAWDDRVEYWDIEDALGVLPRIESRVMDLVARLLGGPSSPAAETSPATASTPGVPAAVVRVGRETKGRRGKGVTTISDLPLDESAMRELAGRLKEKCGTGGTVKDGRIEIQGDHRDRLTVELEHLGYRVKRTGG